MERAKKTLTREQYLKKFSRAARWRLPPQESEEAIADYRELIFREERDESKLVEELGEPVQAAHLLTDVQTYRRWLKVFAVLAFGLFLLAKWAFMAHSPLYLSSFDKWWYPVWVMAVGLPLSLYWFRRHGQKNGPLSKRLVLAKCYDRRWLALYILGVTTAAMVGFVTFNLKSMNLEHASADMVRAYLFTYLVPIGAAGLIGTGVALC